MLSPKEQKSRFSLRSGLSRTRQGMINQAMKHKKDDDYRSGKNKGATNGENVINALHSLFRGDVGSAQKTAANVANFFTPKIVGTLFGIFTFYYIVSWMFSGSQSTDLPKPESNFSTQTHSTATHTMTDSLSSDSYSDIEASIELLNGGNRLQFDDSVMNLMQRSCVKDLAFRLNDDAYFTLHSHFVSMLEFVSTHGHISHLDTETARIGRDGSIFDSAHTEHKVKNSATCSLLRNIISYSHQYNDHYYIEDEWDYWADDYETYGNEHVLSGNIDSDTRDLIKIALEAQQSHSSYDIEMEMYTALHMHCGHWFDNVPHSEHMRLSFQAVNFLDYVIKNDDHTHIPSQDWRVIARKDGSLDLVSPQALHAENVMTCPLMDRIMYFQLGSVETRITKMLDEMSKHEVIPYETHLDLLIADECNAVRTNLGDSEMYNFYSHLQDFIHSVVAKTPMGSADFIVTDTGSILHRDYAKRSGISQSRWLQCPLLSQIVSVGHASTETQNVNEEHFSKESESYKQESEELKRHKYTQNPRHDIYNLAKHLINEERYEFTRLSHDVMEAYFGKEMQTLPTRIQRAMHIAFENAITAIADHNFNVDLNGKRVAFDKNDGSIVMVDKDDNASNHMFSPLLDAAQATLMKIASLTNDAKDFVPETEVKGPMTTDDLVELAHLEEEKDISSAYSRVQTMVYKYCRDTADNILRKYHTSAADIDMILDTMSKHTHVLMEEISEGTHVPESLAVQFGAGGHIKIVGATDSLENGFSCSVADEIVEYGKYVSKTEKSKTSEQIEKEDAEFTKHVNNDGTKHASERESHSKSDLKYYTNLLIGDVRENDDMSFDEDLKYALDNFCTDDSFYSAMNGRAKRTLRVQALHLMKHVLDGSFSMKGISEVAYNEAGDILDSNDVQSGDKVGKCSFLSQAFISMSKQLSK